MQDTHDLKDGAAKAREFRHDENVVLAHPLNEGAEFAVREFFGGTDRFLNPAINMQLPLIRVLEDFKPLIFCGLFIGGDSDIAVHHIGVGSPPWVNGADIRVLSTSLPSECSAASFSLPLLFAANIHAVMIEETVQ